MVKHKLYINDNLTVMNRLIDEGVRVNVIYIDPLYNTGNKQFKVYNDSVADWVEFMQPRLEAAKDILTNDGIIFMSINEDMLFHLKPLCDSIFGFENKIAMFAVKTANQTAGRNVIKNVEYMLAYSKTKDGHFYHPELDRDQEARCTTGRETQKEQVLTIPAGTKVVDVEDGIYYDEDIKHFNSNEDVHLPKGKRIVVKNGKLKNDIKLKARWSNPNDINNWTNKIKTGSTAPLFNKFGKEIKYLYLKGMRFQPIMVKKGRHVPTTLIDGFISKGKNQIKEQIGQTDFTYPKDVNLIRYVISLGIQTPGAVVLDFFAGSGTTLQAVAEYNKINGTDVKCILIDNNENNICYKTTIPRINTLRAGIRPDGSKYSDGMEFDFEYSF